MSGGAAALGTIYDDAIRPALRLLPASMTSREALAMMFAIGLQESEMTARAQVMPKGWQGEPAAMGLWQMERGGGVHGVMKHLSSHQHAYSVLGALGYTDLSEDHVWRSLRTDDVLAAAFARLLLWTDPFPLPKLDNPWRAWDLYLRVWRPGMPRPDDWMGNHTLAVATVLELFA